MEEEEGKKDTFRSPETSVKVLDVHISNEARSPLGPMRLANRVLHVHSRFFLIMQ